jgi:ABC-type glycerol-3-phosphate transport system substrate-binding protein
MAGGWPQIARDTSLEIRLGHHNLERGLTSGTILALRPAKAVRGPVIDKEELLEPDRPTSDSSWNRVLSRREVIKLGALIVAGGAVTPLLAACAAPGAPAPVTPSGAQSGPITVLAEGGDPTSDPVLKKVFDDFKALHPAVVWDIRAPSGLGPEWDRLARATLEAGEPVGLVILDGLFVRAWTRDGLLADLGADPNLADVLTRVPERFHLSGLGEATTRAFPLALSRGVQTTGLYYNKALLDRAGLAIPKTIADLKAMVKPLSALGAAPLVHCSGDVSFNPLLIMWVLPMIAERTGDPLDFVERTLKGEIRYDSPEWTEAFQTIADLRTSGVLLAGSGATDYATMQLLILQGKAAMTYNGSWLLAPLKAGSPTVPFDLHVAPLPLVDGTTKAHSIVSYGAFAMPATPAASRESVYAFLEYASRPAVDMGVVEGLQSYSPISASNVAIHDAVAREFLPMFDDAITSLNWLWEPEIDAEMSNQVQALVKGDTDPGSVGKAIEAVAQELRSSGRSYYP